MKLCSYTILVFVFWTPSARAQLNWEGQTGGLITHFAYTESSSRHGLGHPELAFHDMNAGPMLGNEFRASITLGFLKIGEIGFTRTFNEQGSLPSLSPLFANGFNASHIKFRLVPENVHKTSFVPEIAAGAVVRTRCGVSLKFSNARTLRPQIFISSPPRPSTSQSWCRSL